MPVGGNIDSDLAQAIATMVLQGFDRHFRKFQQITAGAQGRFETADWEAERVASRQRILFYDERVEEAIEALNRAFALGHLDELLWQEVKLQYVLLLQNHQQPELAETFYNSVFCRLFHRRYFNNDHIFVRSAVSTEYIEGNRPAYHVYYPARLGLRNTISRLLRHCEFVTPFEDLHRDVRRITRVLIDYVRRNQKRVYLNFQIQIINAIFYRNKAAYIVGQAINDVDIYPFALPLLNNEQGGLYVDALVFGEKHLSQIFDFSYVYFMVEHPVPSAIVSFLQELMPTRSKEDLYSAIGYQKQGKTDFYRDFLHHLKYSDDTLIMAPGIPGKVMAVFTLPSYPYVFKIIRDWFDPPKEMSRQAVEEKYQLVKQHDRVGRMADMLEYSYVALPRARFDETLFETLLDTCASSIELDGDQVVVKHVYIERRMIPLNMDIAEADDERLDALIRGYGEAIKELAAANIFPGDMLFKNFGVTPLGRVVFYDYDEVRYLTDCNFRRIPPPRYPEDELAAEPWYNVGPNDVFPEEFATFLLGVPRVRKAFLKYHADLLEPEFWWQKQQNIRDGIYEDVFPYPQSIRFPRQNRQTC
ncbi:MAG TPA: bifunctional isocitrate dehydrogenase kinase/phosphatase [Chromatiales bacterium]|nr:bifunctional isocitrate dehydrogenase kinase/phosphatase [Chromatiales bacterium]